MLYLIFFLMIQRAPGYTLLCYTLLFRSISSFIFGSSFFDKQLKLRQINIGFGREFILMNTTYIGNFVEKKFLKFDKECSIEEALKGFKKFDCTEGYFRSEEHTSELQSQPDIVCRLLLEKKKKISPKCSR